MGCGESSAKSEVHSNTSLPPEIRKKRINNLTLHLMQQLKKVKLKVNRRKRVMKIKTEINEEKKK